MEQLSAILPVVVNFIVVIAVLYFATRKSFSKFLVDRSDNIGSEIAEGEKLSADATKLLNEWETNWNASEAHSKQMFDDAKTMLEKIRTTTLEKARLEAERVRKDAKLAAETESVRVVRQLQREVALKSLELSEGYLHKNLNDDDRKKLVGEYVEIVGTNGHAK